MSSFLIAKMDEQMNKMYDNINEKDLIYCEIDRYLIHDLLLKMIQVCDYYWDNIIIPKLEKSNRSEMSIDRERQQFERNVLCYRIMNNETINEPTTRNTILSLMGSIYAFMLQVENNEDIFSDSNFCNTIGLCAVFEWKNEKIKNKSTISYYQLLGIDDGQPFSSKTWFFNKPDLMDKLNEFLTLNIEGLKIKN